MRKEKIQNLTITSSIIIYNFKLAAESDDDHNKSTAIMFSQHLHKACVKFTDTNKDILNPFSNHDMNLFFCIHLKINC